MSDTDLILLYSQRILALASDIPHLGRLVAPTGSAYKRSPQCGSSVTVDLVMKHGRVNSFAQEVRACALGQASASVLGGAVIGRSPQDIQTAHDQLVQMLKHNGPAPTGPFEGIEALMAAREFPNRHASILLAWDATLEALAQG